MGEESPSLKAARQYCRWLTQQSRSHFVLSFRWLPEDRRQGMEAVYAFCRAVDDVVDRDGVSPNDARKELDLWRGEVEAIRAGYPTHPIAVALHDACRRFDIPTTHLNRIITGVEMDLSRRRYRSFEELKVYCEHVASAVGLISVRVFGCRHPAADRYATALGIAFQLTNILRDLKTDGALGRVYLPLEELERFGVKESDLIDGKQSDAIRRLMAFQIERARRYFHEAHLALKETGEEDRLLPARIMAAVYARLLERIAQDGLAPFSRRIRVPPWEQAWAAFGVALGRDRLHGRGGKLG